jgi:misacylated tRNA(Ala) deacylase
MTEPLFATDAYVRSFEARVTAVDPRACAVVLDRTAFYPGGGGQPCDLGWLVVSGQEHAVTKVKRSSAGVGHHVEDVSVFTPGTEVAGRLDWDRRHLLMRTHTALHVLCGVVWRDWGAQVTGGNMEPGKGRMDFEFERLEKELVGEIETRCNVEVEAARDVRIQVLPRAEAFAIPDLIRTKINLLPEGIEEVRTVEIVGLDLQADGGTHVANTSEVGRIRVTDYKSKGAINKRLYIAVE